MATRATESVDNDGLVATYNAASAGGDKITPGDGTFIHVKNRSASPITVTLVTPATLDGTLAIGDRAVSVTNGEANDQLIAVPDTLYRNPTDGLADITWSATATVTFAVVRA